MVKSSPKSYPVVSRALRSASPRPVGHRRGRGGRARAPTSTTDKSHTTAPKEDFDETGYGSVGTRVKRPTT